MVGKRKRRQITHTASLTAAPLSGSQAESLRIIRALTGASARRVGVPMVLLLTGALVSNGATQVRPAAVEVGGSVWSGIIDRSVGLTEAHTRFTVPRVYSTCGTRSNVAVWTGLGGYGPFPFAQNGVSLTPSGFGAWYELFDKNGLGPIASVPLTIRSGDVIELDLRFTVRHTVLTMTWTNISRHQSVSRTLANATRWYNGTTAEWIVERADYDYRHDSPYFAQFSPITFTAAWTRTATGAARSAFPNTFRSELLGKGAYHTLTTTTPRSAQSFTTTWRGCH